MYLRKVVKRAYKIYAEEKRRRCKICHGRGAEFVLRQRMHELEQQQEQELSKHECEHKPAGKAAEQDDRVFQQQDAAHMRFGKAEHTIQPKFPLAAFHKEPVDGKQEPRRKHREHDNAHLKERPRAFPARHACKLAGHRKPAHKKVNAANDRAGDQIRQIDLPAAANIRPCKLKVKSLSQCPHPHPKARKGLQRSGRKRRGSHPPPGKAARKSRRL